MHLASRLSKFGCDVLIVDRDEQRVKELAANGFHAIEANVEDENALKELGIKEAAAVVVSIGENMQGSILATLALKEQRAKNIIARALDDNHGKVLKKVGADLVVLPTRDTAYHLAERLRDDALSERQHLGGEYQLAHVRLGRELHGQTLGQARLPREYRVTAALIMREKSELDTETSEPTADFVLAENDILLVVGKRANINNFEKACGTKRPGR